MKYLLYTLLTLTVGLWAFNMGSFAPVVMPASDEAIASHYINHYLQDKCEKLSNQYGSVWYECDAPELTMGTANPNQIEDPYNPQVTAITPIQGE